jgi:hypothetical protein
MITYMCVYITVREKKLILVSLSEGAMGGRREKENVRE